MIAESTMHTMANNGMKGSVTTMTENMRSSGAGMMTGPSVQDGVAQELGMLLKNHSRLDPTLKRKDAVPNRSGSAPPTVEGSLASSENHFSFAAEPGNHVAASAVVDSEQELRSDPAYLAYYYSHINLNPRLPPPIISQKNYLLAQRLANGGGFIEKKQVHSFDDNNSRSLFSAQPVLPTHKEEREVPEDGNSSLSSLSRQVSDSWMERELHGSRGFHGFSSARPKSLVDLIQQDFPRTPSPVYNQTRLPSHVAKEESMESASGLDSTIPTATTADLNATLSAFNTTIDESSYTTSNPLNFSLPTRHSSGVQALGKFSLGSSSGMLGTVARIPTPDPLKMDDHIVDELSGLQSSSKLGISQARVSSVKDDLNASGVAKLAASFQGLSFSNSQPISSTKSQDTLGISLESQKLQDAQKEVHSRLFQHVQQRTQRPQALRNQSQVPQYEASSLILEQQQQQQQAINSEQISMTHSKLPESHSKVLAANNAYASAAASYMAGNGFYGNSQTSGLLPSQYGMAGYLMNPSSKFTSALAHENAAAVVAGMNAQSIASGLEMHQLYKSVNHSGASSQSRLHDSLYQHYLQQLAADDGHGSLNTTDPSLLREYLAAKHVDHLELQKAKQSTLFSYPSEYRSQLTRSSSHGIPIGSKIGSMSPVYYGSPPGSGFVMPFGNSSFTTPVLPDSPVVPGAVPLRHARVAAAGIYMGWQGQRATDITGDSKSSSLLEELKNSKTRRFELADIVNHVVEFSVDQHGSRFIQQKLEVASPEEKNLIFEEVLPRSLTLMTDVFGNYVIQKFFEHGSPEQRSKLASKLIGHVLDLSLQMYGCRVIQKALEVVDVDQQVQIVSELDGHIMRCVRDQNGNHVIQKCIECVPTEHIEFIISACYGQVVMLSTHPYGCRVIQRVLEHCTDEEKQNSIVGDILRSTCELAQDQYGNYVVQHVLEHGKPHEKSEIMKKLAGQIVQMSQHKFASNVVEKCLEFGGPVERQILISEMLGNTDENEPLQAMMKDQYANYVVQKVLETCDDQQRELLLSRIKVHLHALKKYTYGKHIVARVEKLVAAGERRVAQTLV